MAQIDLPALVIPDDRIVTSDNYYSGLDYPEMPFFPFSPADFRAKDLPIKYAQNRYEIVGSGPEDKKCKSLCFDNKYWDCTTGQCKEYSSYKISTGSSNQVNNEWLEINYIYAAGGSPVSKQETFFQKNYGLSNWNSNMGRTNSISISRSSLSALANYTEINQPNFCYNSSGLIGSGFKDSEYIYRLFLPKALDCGILIYDWVVSNLFISLSMLPGLSDSEIEQKEYYYAHCYIENLVLHIPAKITYIK